MENRGPLQPTIVEVGHPSGTDYYYICKGFINGDIFHTVLSVQGIYIIHLNNLWIGDKISWLRINIDKQIPWTEIKSLTDNALFEYTNILKKLINLNIFFPIAWTVNDSEFEFELKASYVYYKGLYNILSIIKEDNVCMYAHLLDKIMYTYWGYNWPDITLENSCKIYSKLSSKLPFLSYAPLFNIQFMSWDEAKRGEVFSVIFSPIDGNCFPTKYEEESYDGLFNLRENMSGPS